VTAVADLLHRLRVHRHLLGNGRAGRGGHDAEVVDDEVRIDAGCAELPVHLQRGALIRAAVEHEEPAEIPAVRIEQRDVHVLDATVRLHAPAHADELVEHVDGALLAAANRLAEPDEYGSIRHADSFLSLDAPNLSDRDARGKGCLRQMPSCTRIGP
jgi:hypothetical protein